jgi:hypothetical protein
MLVDLEELQEKVYEMIKKLIMDGYYKHDIILKMIQNQNEN